MHFAAQHVMRRAHNPAASRIVGTLMLVIGIVSLGMGYGMRKAGLFGMLFLFGGAYLTIHGVALCTASDRTTAREIMIMVATLLALAAFIWFTSLDASIWG